MLVKAIYFMPAVNSPRSAKRRDRLRYNRQAKTYVEFALWRHSVTHGKAGETFFNFLAFSILTYRTTFGISIFINNGARQMAYTITSEHSDRTFTFSSEVAYEAALDWHNDKNNTKQKMVEFCAAHGIDISADENTLVEDWADIAMECWAANQ